MCLLLLHFMRFTSFIVKIWNRKKAKSLSVNREVLELYYPSWSKVPPLLRPDLTLLIVSVIILG